jgi:hypothetical protein
LCRCSNTLRPAQNAAETRIKAAFTAILKQQFKPDLHHRGAGAAALAPLRVKARVARCARTAALCLDGKAAAHGEHF